ncbi:MAG: hypothetical protein PG981_001343 [Wolbachia endosymbiont of Ctenocephalides orientis wCori]|nr:MAG: hypothetical protein PG981_001343 [Wolbachia endosymbiont of Ctenocephalides orientis wCori]
MTTNIENIVHEGDMVFVHQEINAENNSSLDEIECEEEFSDAKSDFDFFEDALAIKSAIEREDAVKKLVLGGFNINSFKNGQTILDIAIERKFPSKFVKFLIDNGAKINTVDSNGCTVLHRAVTKKNIRVINLLLETNKREVEEYFLAKFLPEFMFIHQVEINAINHEGFTALDYAKQKTRIYCLLQQYGAKHSEKFMHFCSINIDKLDLNKLASDSNYCFDVISKVLEIDNKNTKEKWLLKNGASIGVAKDGKTLLSVTIEEGNLENAILLIKKGVSEGINAQDNNGRTLLLNAIINNKLSDAKYFIEKGININIPDNNGNNALHHASSNLGMQAFFVNLVDKGMNLYSKNNANLTPFEYALQVRIKPNEVANLFKIYVNKGNVRENTQLVKKARLASGETLLEYFIDNKLFDSAQSCINLGINVNQPLNDGSSLLIKALQNSNIEGVAFLLKNGANTNLGHGSKNKNTRLYLKVAVGCAVAFSLGMGIVATVTLVQMSCVAIAMTAVASLLTVVASITLLILYKKVKSEKREAQPVISNANFAESAENLFSELGSIPERVVEAGALYFEVQKSIEKIAEEMECKQEFIEARIQDFQQSLAKRFSSLESSHDLGNTPLEQISSHIKHALKIYSNLPLSNSHLASLIYNLSWEVSSTIFAAITDPTLAGTIFSAVKDRRWPENTQWSEALKKAAPNLIRNQKLVQNVIVPTLVDVLKNLSQSKEERKFIVYTLVAIRGMMNEVYTPSLQASLPRILGREFANNINNIVVAIKDLLHSCDEKEAERAQIANNFDYLIGKLDSEKTENLTTYLREKVVSLTEFRGQVTHRDKQSIRKLVDYCLDPKPSDELAAKTLLDNLRVYIQNDCTFVTHDANSNLLNPNITKHVNLGITKHVNPDITKTRHGVTQHSDSARILACA